MGLFLTESSGLAGLFGGNQTMVIIVYVLFLIAIMYFLMIRPQKKEEQKKKELMAGLAIGDSVLTASGFYGIIIDMTADTVIVEFGNNKNCRIPMQKQAIIRSEKPSFKSEASATDKK
ncbi:MAG: preprotein translocase subunit YajC [Lachnospiraceae bacterium]|nr:preprotein translocase subunit YajC [Lachnospiraceae bacterium]